MTPLQLAAEARRLVAHPDRHLGANNCVAAAFVVRAGLEQALEAFWSVHVRGMDAVTNRAQLIALPFFMDAGLAVEVRAAWYQLSEACHPDVYELAPPPGDVIAAATLVERLVSAI